MNWLGCENNRRVPKIGTGTLDPTSAECGCWWLGLCWWWFRLTGPPCWHARRSCWRWASACVLASRARRSRTSWSRPGQRPLEARRSSAIPPEARRSALRGCKGRLIHPVANRQSMKLWDRLDNCTSLCVRIWNRSATSAWSVDTTYGCSECPPSSPGRFRTEPCSANDSGMAGKSRRANGRHDSSGREPFLASTVQGRAASRRLELEYKTWERNKEECHYEWL